MHDIASNSNLIRLMISKPMLRSMLWPFLIPWARGTTVLNSSGLSMFNVNKCIYLDLFVNIAGPCSFACVLKEGSHNINRNYQSGKNRQYGSANVAITNKKNALTTATTKYAYASLMPTILFCGARTYILTMVPVCNYTKTTPDRCVVLKKEV